MSLEPRGRDAAQRARAAVDRVPVPGSAAVISDRRRRRRTRATATGAVAVLVVIVGAVAVARGADRSGRPRVETRPTPARATTTTTGPGSIVGGPQVRVFAGLPALDASLAPAPVVPVTTVSVPGNRPVLGFVGYSGSTVWISSESSASPTGGEVFPLDGSVEQIQTSGGPMSFAEGGGARWVYERDYTNPGQQYRLERYGNDTPPIVSDNPVPADGQPAAGPLVVSNGAVWIPLRNGVARMDLDTGKLAAMLPLPFDQGRSLVASGAQLVVSDNNAVRTIDSATNAVSAPVAVAAKGEFIVGLANVDGHIWVDLANGLISQTLVRLDSSLHPDAELQLPLEAGAGALQSANGVLWLVAPLRIGVPPNETATDQAVLLIDPQSASVARTVVLHGFAGSVAWTAPTEVLFGGWQRQGAGGSVDATLYKLTIDDRPRERPQATKPFG